MMTKRAEKAALTFTAWIDQISWIALCDFLVTDLSLESRPRTNNEAVSTEILKTCVCKETCLYLNSTKNLTVQVFVSLIGFTVVSVQSSFGNIKVYGHTLSVMSCFQRVVVSVFY